MTAWAQRIETRLQGLSCLGFVSQQVMPVVLHELSAILPTLGNLRFAVDPASSTAPRTSVDGEPLTASSRHLRLRFVDHGRVLGGITLWRDDPGEPWRREELRLFEAIRHYVAHGLHLRDSVGAPLIDSGTVGIVVCDRLGRPLSATCDGRRLLALALKPDQAQGVWPELPRRLPAPLLRLCRRAPTEIGSGPVHRIDNPWGRFTISAEPIDEGARDGHIILTIGHELPLPAILVRNVEHLPLSRRQSQIALVLASGATNEIIAHRFGISPHTANEHARSIYSRLAIHNRAELLTRLVAAHA
jgi:DNA-binding CsgD family transcriptional regulator